MGEVITFAVAIIQAREDPQYLDMALYAHPFKIAIKIREIGGYGQTELARLLPITDQPVQDAFLIPTYVRILEERYQVISDGSVDCILKIDNAWIRSRHHQVARVIV